MVVGSALFVSGSALLASVASFVAAAIGEDGGVFSPDSAATESLAAVGSVAAAVVVAVAVSVIASWRGTGWW